MLFSPQLLTLTPEKLVVVAKNFIDKNFFTTNVYTLRVKVLIFYFFCKIISTSFLPENVTMIFFFCLRLGDDAILSILDLHLHK